MRAVASRGRRSAEADCGGTRWDAAGCGGTHLQLLGHDVLLEEFLHASAELALDKRRRRLHSLSGVLKLVEGLQLHPVAAQAPNVSSVGSALTTAPIRACAQAAHAFLAAAALVKASQMSSGFFRRPESVTLKRQWPAGESKSTSIPSDRRQRTARPTERAGLAGAVLPPQKENRGPRYRGPIKIEDVRSVCVPALLASVTRQSQTNHKKRISPAVSV